MKPRKDRLPYGKWEKALLSNAQIATLRENGKEHIPEEIWINGRYEVWVHRDVNYDGNWPKMHWLSIKRIDKEPIRSWRDLQRIKNDIIGDEHEALELFPAESRLVDTSNQYHLFVLADKTLRFPIGYMNRLVADEHDGGFKQATWEQKPDDAVTAEEMERLAEEERKKVAKKKKARTTVKSVRRKRKKKAKTDSNESPEYEPVRCNQCGYTVTPERGPPTESLSPKAVYYRCPRCKTMLVGDDLMPVDDLS